MAKKKHQIHQKHKHTIAIMLLIIAISAMAYQVQQGNRMQFLSAQVLTTPDEIAMQNAFIQEFGAPFEILVPNPENPTPEIQQWINNYNATLSQAPTASSRALQASPTHTTINPLELSPKTNPFLRSNPFKGSMGYDETEQIKLEAKMNHNPFVGNNIFEGTLAQTTQSPTTTIQSVTTTSSPTTQQETSSTATIQLEQKSSSVLQKDQVTEHLENLLDQQINNKVKQLEQSFSQMFAEMELQLNNQIAKVAAQMQEFEKDQMQKAMQSILELEEMDKQLRSHTVIENDLLLTDIHEQVQVNVNKGTIATKLDSKTTKDEIKLGTPQVITSQNAHAITSEFSAESQQTLNQILASTDTTIIHLPTSSRNGQSQHNKITGLQFSRPITIKAPIPKSSQTSNETLVAVVFDEITGKQKSLVPVVIHPVTNQAVFESDAASFFSILTKKQAVSLGYSKPTPTFTDLVGDWGWAGIFVSELAEMEAVEPSPTKEFEPEKEISRAEITKLALDTFGFSLLPNKTETGLTDTKDHWSAPYIRRAKEVDIISGYPDKTFKPDKKVSRAEALKIFLKAAFIDAAQYATTGIFLDVTADQWFAPYVDYAAKNEIVTGYGDGTFGPEKLVTKAAAAKMAVKIRENKYATMGILSLPPKRK
jgi:hypothetical protein